MECHSAAQESLLIKLQRQHSTLKDSLIKLAALSEGLAKDKVELNRIVLQVSLCGFSQMYRCAAERTKRNFHLFQTEGEKTELSERRCEAEGKRAAAREDAARAQKEMMNLRAEKQAFESSHILLRELCQKLEAELSLLHRERAEALKKQSEVRACWSFTPLLAPTTWENCAYVINSFHHTHAACFCYTKMYRSSHSGFFKIIIIIF